MGSPKAKPEAGNPSELYFSEIVKPIDNYSLKNKSEFYAEMLKGRFELNINQDLPMQQ